MSAERIRQARELCSLTQEELAKKIGISQPAIAQIESGQYTPSPSMEQSIALHTGFDLSFLRKPEPPVDFPVGSILYRSKAKVSARDRVRAHRLAQLLFEIVSSLKAKLRPIPVVLPRLNEQNPIEAAKLARSSLGLSPDTPIQNIMSVVERAGVLVLRLPLEIEGLDGFSAWVGKNHETPVICLMGKSVGYRSRYTLSEETGHLILHSPLAGTVEQAEEEVKLFTGEFVLPEEAMHREMGTPVTLASLAPLRHKWGASLQFLAHRSKDIGITTPNQYRYLIQQISMRGWRTVKQEPGDESIPQEQPKAVSKMIEVVYGSDSDFSRIRKDTGVPVGLLKSILLPATSGDRATPAVLQMKNKIKREELG